ncbi:hypothetical protein HUW51_06885 [Adhaeribacter swui]|uniref:Uncharacterized protein n=1 Tax=Adhaeribacter swui TaxID=2086471 RepID=A0A7G7G5N2_9BACT|nr:hypothetical protein [Adhaeribacter swui]QNF32466.1 hypothetical protein HUW51_06885 [Adhaeribacter swui]
MMKNFNSTFAPIFLLLFTVLVTACNNEPEAPTVLQLVSSTNQNYVSENITKPGGASVTTGVYAQAPAENVSLTKFLVTLNYDTAATPDKKYEMIYLDSTLAPETKSFSMPVVYTPRNLASRETWNFTVTDSNNKTYTRSVRIRTTSTANTYQSTYYTYSNVLLIRVNPLVVPVSLYTFASATGTAFPTYAINEQSANIDFVLNNIGTQKPSLSLIKGDSLVRTALTLEGFNEINNVTKIKNAYPSAPGQARAENLKVNDVLAFRTRKNKMAVLRISEVFRTQDSLRFELKVEK